MSWLRFLLGRHSHTRTLPPLQLSHAVANSSILSDTHEAVSVGAVACTDVVVVAKGVLVPTALEALAINEHPPHPFALLEWRWPEVDPKVPRHLLQRILPQAVPPLLDARLPILHPLADGRRGTAWPREVPILPATAGRVVMTGSLLQLLLNHRGALTSEAVVVTLIDGVWHLHVQIYVWLVPVDVRQGNSKGLHAQTLKLCVAHCLTDLVKHFHLPWHHRKSCKERLHKRLVLRLQPCEERLRHT
mmetsp:Transcript_30111/g.70049  ORF Transcript_30111/g.70049 Transcript_30111/m.70049 type:complete len:246 (-) Transcript_30111:1488-2225(-)